MKAVLMPSGKWRARYVDHYEVKDGRRRVVLGSVTRDTERAAIRAAEDAEAAARDLSHSVGACIRDYIAIKEPVLSPATLRAYKSLEKNAFGDIAHLRPGDLKGPRLQRWVNDYSADHKAKSVKNAYSLLVESVHYFSPVRLSASLPKTYDAFLYTPTDDDIKILLSLSAGSELEKAILLAAFGTLRRGEICGLQYTDIQNNIVYIRRAMVELRGGGTALKNPKTPRSVRAVALPPDVLQVVLRDPNPSGFVVDMTPTAISNAFARLLDGSGLQRFRFHDLRAYAASIRHALGVPDQYIMQDGGWRSDAVLKKIYRRTLADREQKYTELVNDHFSGMLK